MRADCDSYFVTTYIQTDAVWKRKKKMKRRRKRKLNGKIIKQIKQKKIRLI